jgi:O-antigen/teichoic acid export membrane protein
MIILNTFIEKVNNNSLYKNSFWAVFGNGIGNFLMLLSGIFIARMLGKDLYGEYGMVKTTMYTMATFSTLAFGNTTTKFIADYIQKDLPSVKSIIKSSVWIVVLFSISTCVFLYLLSNKIALFVNEPQLADAFKFLGVLIIFRALNTLGAGLLGGFKDFKHVGINNIVAGSIMFLLCIPLTSLYSLTGAYISLITSQIVLCILNLFFVYRHQKGIQTYSNTNFSKLLLVFSFPFALTEFIYTVTTWGGSMVVTKYASLGELGMYTACAQWNAIILFMPGLLGNVILSYLSSSASGSEKVHHHQLVKRMLLVNFLSTLLPLAIVAVAASYIAQYYGSTFVGMDSILRIGILATIFTCLSRVFDSNLMSIGKRWTAFTICSSSYIMSLIGAIILMKLTNGVNAAMNMTKFGLFMSVSLLIVYVVEYLIRYRSHKSHINS